MPGTCDIVAGIVNAMTLLPIYLAVVGDHRRFDARHRIVNGIAFIAILLTVVVSLVDFLFVNAVDFRGALAALAGAVTLYVHSRVMGRSGFIVLAVAMACFALVFALAWFDHGGLFGTTAFLIVVMLPATLLVSPSRRRYLLFAAVALVFVALVVWEAFDQSVRIVGGLPSVRFFESMAVFIICALGAFGLFSVGMRSLRSERALAEQFAARIEALASIDGLTGLLNHSAVFKAVEDEVLRTRRTGRTFSLIMVDLDDFKSVNGQFGHQYGDQILERAGKAIQDCVRATDRAGRYGGEEFLVVLPETDLSGALAVAERMLGCIGGVPVGQDGRVLACSIGVFQFDGRTPAESIHAADELMYRAKKDGGARVVAGTPSLPPGRLEVQTA
ncbi:MAG TPA: GGDEF domain-containing protein [Myxococcota bacterium]|nr:GGDEF domain-containing protein [Myxococcota bacterium]